MRTESIVAQRDLQLPHVQLLDADALHCDDPALRSLARELTANSGVAFVSRSYSFPYALVAWHSGPVGVDIERIGRCDSAFANLICTREERLDANGVRDLDAYLTSLWSAKEALAKGLGDALRYEPSLLGSPLRWPRGRAGAWSSEQLTVDREHVAWVCWRSIEACAEPGIIALSAADGNGVLARLLRDSRSTPYDA